jgi:hypothetical protein
LPAPTLGSFQTLGGGGGMHARPLRPLLRPGDAIFGGQTGSVLRVAGGLGVALRPLGSSQVLFLASERDGAEASD